MHPIARACAAVTFVGIVASRDADAQQPVRALPQWEVAGGASLSPNAGLLAGAGVNLRAGWYARVGVAAYAGGVRRSGRFVGTQRVEGTARFLLDPFAERRRGLYAGAGLGAQRGSDGGVRALLLGVVGVEGARAGKVVPAVELTLGGGARLAVVLRGRRPQGR